MVEIEVLQWVVVVDTVLAGSSYEVFGTLYSVDAAAVARVCSATPAVAPVSVVSTVSDGPVLLVVKVGGPTQVAPEIDEICCDDFLLKNHCFDFSGSVETVVLTSGSVNQNFQPCGRTGIFYYDIFVPIYMEANLHAGTCSFLLTCIHFFCCSKYSFCLVFDCCQTMLQRSVLSQEFHFALLPKLLDTLVVFLLFLSPSRSLPCIFYKIL